MLEPIIGFSIFILIITFIFYLGNKNRSKEYEDLKEKMSRNTKLFISQTRCSTMTIGLKNNNFLFNKCDIYLTENALAILGYSKSSFIKQLSKPIILTDAIEYYSLKFPYAYVKPMKSIEFNKNIGKLKFGEKKITKTEVVITLKSLGEREVKTIKDVALKNRWK